MTKSDITKKYQTASIVLFWIGVLLTIAPVLVYAVIGFVNGDVKEKITLGVTLIIAISLVIINILFKYHIRSTIWILVLGIYFCIDNIMPLLLIVSVCTILDEFLIEPLHKKYKQRAIINKEIDRRQQ